MLCMGCGALLNESQIKNGNGKCPFCGSEDLNSEIYNYQFSFGDYFEIYNISNDAQFILQMIKLKNENPIDYQLKLKQFHQTDQKPKCPTCGSTNIGKISVGKKIGGSMLFGIFSSDVRNTIHCKNCGAKW